MMKLNRRIYVITLTLCFCLSVSVQVLGQKFQDAVSYLSTATSIGKSIDQLNFGSISNAIGDKKIVILSEVNHSDGTSLQLISEVVKYLIDTLGFNMVLAEAGITDVASVVSKLKKEVNVNNSKPYLRSYMFDRKYGFHLLSYFQNKIKQNQLGFHGLDFQLGIEDNILEFLAQTNLLLKKENYNRDLDEIEQLLLELPKYGYQSYLSDQNVEIISKNVSRIISELLEMKPVTSEISYLIHQWQNLHRYSIWLNKTWSYQDKLDKDRFKNIYNASRDSVMAENFKWIFHNSKQDSKYIILVSAYHSLRNSRDIDEFVKCCKPDSISTFVERIWSEYCDEIYSIVFLGAEGVRGLDRYTTWKYPRAKNNSLENVIKKSGNQFGFIPLKVAIGESPWFKLYSTRILNQSFISANWAGHYDGIFYIKKMESNWYHR